MIDDKALKAFNKKASGAFTNLLNEMHSNAKEFVGALEKSSEDKAAKAREVLHSINLALIDMLDDKLKKEDFDLSFKTWNRTLVTLAKTLQNETTEEYYSKLKSGIGSIAKFVFSLIL